MIWQYVSKNFLRRKVRTLMMVLSLIVSTGLMTVMSATVETMRLSDSALTDSSPVDFDLTVFRTDTYPDPFVPVEEATTRLLASDERITGVHPRIEQTCRLRVIEHPAIADGGQASGDGMRVDLSIGNAEVHIGPADDLNDSATLVALDPSESIGRTRVVSGTYALGDGQAVITEQTANGLNVGLGDTVEVEYAFPLPREEGSIGSAGASQRHAVGTFQVVGIIQQAGVIMQGSNYPIIVHLSDAQAFLRLPDRAQYLGVTVDPALYKANNARKVALNVRDVAFSMQAALGNDYIYAMDKALGMEESYFAYMIIHALITVYGLMSLGVVSLLLHTLVMTNVREQRRELAVLRILGSPQKLLFHIVIGEVLLIGAIGVGLGVLLGQTLTAYVVVPLIQRQFEEGLAATTLAPTISAASVLPVVGAALVVLILSALKPAQDAASTKVVHAINPSVADNIQIEDLEQLRERNPNGKLLLIGIAILIVVAMMFALIMVENIGDEMVYAGIFLAILGLLVVGFVLIFFVLARPLEKLVLMIAGLIWPKLAYFAEKNVGRSRQRNTLISLMVLVSGVLPSFLATQSAINYANIDTDTRLNSGAPVSIRAALPWGEPETVRNLYLFKPSLLEKDVPALEGIDQAVAQTPGFASEITDAIGVRKGEASLVGVSGDLGSVLYNDLAVWVQGGRESLSALADDDHAIILSEGMAKGLAVDVGDNVQLRGAGIDHQREMRVVGIVQRLPGFYGIGRIQAQAMHGGVALVNLDAHRDLSTDPTYALPEPDAPTYERILATMTPGADPATVEMDLVQNLRQKARLWTNITELTVERRYSDQRETQLWLIVLTAVSFVTAVFGVFAVIYVTIYSRRLEIGMIKAIGARKREIHGMLSIESISMALGAALTGILAGASIAYLFSYVDSALTMRPFRFTVDTTVMPFVVVLVTLAALIGTVLSARRMVKRRAVEILRMS